MSKVPSRCVNHIKISPLQMLITRQETIGTVTGSAAWSDSGAKDKSDGIDGMKAASADRDPATEGYGKIEELAGKVTGCEGMEHEGAESKREV